MNYFDQALIEKQKESESYALIAHRYMQRRRFFLALTNRVRKVCPPKVELGMRLGGGIGHYSAVFYVADARSKSPKELLSTLFKLEKIFGNLNSNISNNGGSITYSGGKYSTLGKIDMYISLSYSWRKPANSTCQIIVTGQRETERYEVVKCKEPIYQVVCP